MLINFSELTRPLIGQPITHAWKGYGSAIFLEIGELDSSQRRDNACEHCIAIEWDWRVEFDGKVLFNSSNSTPIISDRVAQLKDAEIKSITHYGDIPELLIHLSTGHRIRTAVMATGDPEWSIRVGGGAWLHVVDGALVDGAAIANMTPERTELFRVASQTAERWGCTELQPSLGDCGECVHFIRLAGHANMLDYGACTSADSPLDGRVVNLRSGCPQFKAKSGGQ
ncbi:DUF3027 domain-containing protein [Mariniblastus sp.]|nr:DUF3027 domain-containing protein [Mariniblastus sp.]